MKKIIFKSIFFILLLASIAACKKEVYPEELHFKVIDSYTQKPIPNATVQLLKVWRHPVKVGNNAKDDAWFPEYGRKHMEEIQVGTTDQYGKVSFSQDHKNYLYIIPGAIANGYQSPLLDTLHKVSKKKDDSEVYLIEMKVKIKTTFLFKSYTTGFNTDSVVFASSEHLKVMHGANIDDTIEIYTANSTDPYSKVWYTVDIYRNGKKQTICHYVKSYPNAENVFPINIDI
jgi:hypothetical protein